MSPALNASTRRCVALLDEPGQPPGLLRQLPELALDLGLGTAACRRTGTASGGRRRSRRSSPFREWSPRARGTAARAGGPCRTASALGQGVDGLVVDRLVRDRLPAPGLRGPARTTVAAAAPPRRRSSRPGDMDSSRSAPCQAAVSTRTSAAPAADSVRAQAMRGRAGGEDVVDEHRPRGPRPRPLAADGEGAGDVGPAGGRRRPGLGPWCPARRTSALRHRQAASAARARAPAARPD